MDTGTMPSAWAEEVLSQESPRQRARIWPSWWRRAVRRVNGLTLEGLLLSTAVGGFVLMMLFNLVRAALHFDRWEWMVQ